MLSHIPIISGLRELDRGPRKFLLFMAFNIMSWHCLAGSVLILFARHLEMPASWVGILISFAPFSQLVVLATVPVVERFGSKRVLVTAWTLRNLAAMSVLTIPWLAGPDNQRVGWYILMAGTLGFCITRAFGTGGWFPWLHEIVPERQRGTYFSTEQAIVQTTVIALTLTAAVVLGRRPTLSRFLFIYTLGICAGLISIVRMLRIPGGRRPVHSPPLKQSFTSYRRVLSDRAFLQYVVLAATSIGCLNWLGSAHIMYMRDMLNLSSGTIMLLSSLSALAIAVTVRSWGKFADKEGSSQAISLTLFAHSLVAFAWMSLVPNGRVTLILVAPIMASGYVFGGACWASMQHGLLARIPDDKGRASYASVYTFCTALVFGVTPVLVGQVIDRWELAGFRACFLISGLLGISCAVAASRTPAEKAAPAPALERLLRPTMPLRTVARILWITVGLDSSAKTE